jgi:multimeric flavodoxin WrbA
MPKDILILSGSPKRDGNTEMLAGWFAEGARSEGARIVFVRAASLKFKAVGCTSCRACQQRKPYGCVIEDDVAAVLKQMIEADVIVMATPLYFYGPSAQLKAVVDRMFSLYKWDNKAGTMETPLRGKTLVLLASAYEDVGIDELREPFALTAGYTGMPFESLLVANAGVSGDIKDRTGVREQAFALGKKVV